MKVNFNCKNRYYLLRVMLLFDFPIHYGMKRSPQIEWHNKRGISHFPWMAL
jgi:hypothetical protein